MYLCIISQFLDESSNLKAGCKKDVVHDAFDASYASYIDNRSNFFIYEKSDHIPSSYIVLMVHVVQGRQYIHIDDGASIAEMEY